jgi:archaellum component FlaC
VNAFTWPWQHNSVSPSAPPSTNTEAIKAQHRADTLNEKLTQEKAANNAASAENRVTRADLLKTVEHMQSLAKELQSDLDSEKAAHADVGKALAETRLDLDTATTQVTTLKKQVNDLTKKANDAIAAHDHLVSKLHLAKWIVSGLWLGLCALVALRLQAIPILGQYALYGVAAIAAGGTVFIWLWL